MVGRSLKVAVAVLLVFNGLVSENAEARSRFRRRISGRQSLSVRFRRPSVGRFNSFRFPTPISFPVPTPAFAPRESHNLRTPISPPVTRPIDPTPVRPVPTPAAGDKLSVFCDVGCAADLFDAHDCWVPREGQLAIVPFSAEGSNLCKAQRNLCLEIRETGQDPDSHPLVCRQKSSGNVVIRREPGKEGRVSGSVERHMGDFMPGTTPRGGLTVTPIPEGRVLVFSGELSQKRGADGFNIPRAVETQGRVPVKTLRADKDGKFQVDLPPGTYTIVTEINGELRHTDGAGPRHPNKNWSTITVKAGEQSEYKIVDDQTTH